MQNYLQSLGGNGGTGFAANYLSSLEKPTQPSTPTKISGPTYAGPVASNTGATSTNPTPSPAKTAYTNSLKSPTPVSNTPTPPVVPQNQPITGNTTTPSGATVNATTGATVSTPPTQDTSYKDAYNAYIQSLQPNADVTKATQNLNDLNLQAQKDQETALDRGDTLGFATGEASRVAKNNSFGIDAATNTLNALTGEQTANTNANKARLDFQSSLQTNEKPYTVGNDTYQLNPDSGKYEKISSTPAKLDTSVVDVNGNKVLVNNQTGETIKNLGSSTDTSGNSGGAYITGTNPIVDSWVSNINSGKAKLSDITGNPNLKSLVSQGLSQAGGSANDILGTTSKSLQELNDLVTNDSGFSGAVGSKVAFGTLGGLVPGGLSGSSEANFNAKLNQVKNDVILPNLTLLHGLGRVTDREFQALTSAVTSLSTNLSEDAFKSELKNITDTINAKISGKAQTPSLINASPITAPDGTQVIITD